MANGRYLIVRGEPIKQYDGTYSIVNKDFLRKKPKDKRVPNFRTRKTVQVRDLSESQEKRLLLSNVPLEDLVKVFDQLQKGGISAGAMQKPGQEGYDIYGKLNPHHPNFEQLKRGHWPKKYPTINFQNLFKQ
jgi:hypothetical protein